jgi:hypothetical protein
MSGQTVQVSRLRKDKEPADTVLARVDRAKTLLAEAKTISEANHVVALAEAARIYARRIDAGNDAINYASEIRLWAERKLGELLKKTPKNEGAKGLKGGGTRGSKKEPRVQQTPTLAESGISKKLSSRAQIVVHDRAFYHDLHVFHVTAHCFPLRLWKQCAFEITGVAVPSPAP